VTISNKYTHCRWSNSFKGFNLLKACSKIFCVFNKHVSLIYNLSITSLHVDTNICIGDKSRRTRETKQRDHRYWSFDQTIGKIIATN
jgi:hypothetical protein